MFRNRAKGLMGSRYSLSNIDSLETTVKTRRIFNLFLFESISRYEK